MDHVAILKKSKHLLNKIISGEKTIESRWYLSKTAPWGRIHTDDTIYFKDSGEPITAKAKVSEVMQYYLPQTNILHLIQKFGKEIGIPDEKFAETAEKCKQKKYCILIRLKNVQKIQPIEISKKGYGLMSAWMCVGDINKVILQHASQPTQQS